MKTLIVVPARFGSSRFPGKPLAEIAGTAMVTRVARRAEAAARALEDASSVVATDDARILSHCQHHGLNAVMTDPDLPSGSDRALAAAEALGKSQGEILGEPPDLIINLQGDAPFTPVEHITAMAEALANTDADASTPCVRLSWTELDELREAKRTTPFSGTTCVFDATGRALWFSKNIIPAIRNEDELRAESELSPVHRHIGLYGFRREALRIYTEAKPTVLETCEGLEQLRLLENGLSIQCVVVEPPQISISGIDTPEDITRAEALIARHGDPDLSLS